MCSEGRRCPICDRSEFEGFRLCKYCGKPLSPNQAAIEAKEERDREAATLRKLAEEADKERDREAAELRKLAEKAVGKTPKAYETSIAALVAERIGLSEDGKPIKIWQRRRYPGRSSGQDHEIDLSFEIDVAGTRVLVLVECKQYGRNVGVDEALEFSARLDDIGAHKGILVTTHGFDKGAVKVAKAKGIALVVANSPEFTIIGRAAGPQPPRYSSVFFHASRADIRREKAAVYLQFSPMDEMTHLAIHPIGTEWPVRGTPVFLEIVETGSDCLMSPGAIPLRVPKGQRF